MAEIPLLVIIPGWWQPTDSWHDFLTAARKQNAGFDGIVVSLPSKTDVASRQAGLPRDVAAVRAALETVVEEGRMVVLLCHCSGGIIGSNAVEGYDLAARRRAGKQGGVMSIIYLAAFILPKRHTLFGIVGNLDIYQWVHIDPDREATNPDMFRDGLKRLFTRSSISVLDVTPTYEPWAHGIPCSYIYTELDNAVSHWDQQKMVARVLGLAPPTLTLHSFHCPFIDIPDDLARAIHRMLYDGY